MKTSTSAFLTMAVAAMLVTGLAGLGEVARPESVPPLPAQGEPRAPIGLLWAQRFSVAQTYTHWWRAERPRVSEGWLLVLAVDPDLVYPRQLRQPVLYVGDQTAERINVGWPSGKVVALVPGDFELDRSPIYFGDAVLPEEVDAAHCQSELAVAAADGVRPPSAARVDAVARDTLRVADDYVLRQKAVDLVEAFAPDEVDLISGMRAPRVR